MRNDPNCCMKAHLISLTAMFDRARQLNRMDFQASSAATVFPKIHVAADTRALGFSMTEARSRLLSSQNPFQLGISKYL